MASPIFFGGHLGLPGAEVESCDPKRVVEPLRRFIRSGKCRLGVCRDGGGGGVLDACKRGRQLRSWDTANLWRGVSGGVIVDEPGGWSVSRRKALECLRQQVLQYGELVGVAVVNNHRLH